MDMKPVKTIALLGGTGRTGSLVLQMAFDEGYQLRVLARKTAKVQIKHPNVIVIEGDATNRSKLEELIDGADVVISVLGHVKNSSRDFQTQSMEMVTGIMKQRKTSRIIVLTGAGVYFPGDKTSMGGQLLTFLIKHLAPARFNDGVGLSNVIAKSGLQYTLVRAPLLTNETLKGNYRTGNLPLSFFSRISRADMAHFIVSQIESMRWIQQAPFVCY